MPFSHGMGAYPPLTKKEQNWNDPIWIVGTKHKV